MSLDTELFDETTKNEKSDDDLNNKLEHESNNLNDSTDQILEVNTSEVIQKNKNADTILMNSSHIKNIENSISKIMQGDAMQFIPFASTLFEFLTEDIPESNDKMKVAHHIGTKAAFIMSIACKASDTQKKEEEINNQDKKYLKIHDIIGCIFAINMLHSSIDTLKILGFIYLMYRIISTKELIHNKPLIEKNNVILSIVCAWIHLESEVGVWNKIQCGIYFICLWNSAWNACKFLIH